MIEEVKALQARIGMSQRELAQSIGISEQSLSDKLHGRCGFTRKDLTALADFFNVSTDYLLGRIPTFWPSPGMCAGSDGHPAQEVE